MAAKFKINNPSKLLVPGLVALLIVAAFLVGSLLTKVSMLEKDGVPIKGVAQQAGTQPSNAQPNPLTPVKAETLNIPQVKADEHIRGSKDAKLTWIEYSDLECPFCQKIHPDLQKMLSEYQGSVSWVYRHFPLDQIHPGARPAANAAECVASLSGEDSFWKFIDNIFTDQTTLTEARFTSTAKSLGVSEDKFKTCFSAKQFDSKISDQQDGGSQAGVNGTPGNFLLDDKGNAWVIPGAVPYATIKQVVDSALSF